MNSRSRILTVSTGACFALGVVSACKDPFPPDTMAVAATGGAPALEDCAASTEWLPNTPPVQMYQPLPHPATECPFYRGGWQNFLIATQPVDAQGTPALLTFPTIETVFTPSVPYGPNRSFLGDIKQAGQREILIDQNGNAIYYGIHVNQAFADFIHANQLETAKAIQAYSSDPTLKNLFFPAGVSEFKSAWQIVDTDHPPADLADYIVLKTTVPTLHTAQDAQGNKQIVEDKNAPRPVTVRLLAIHVVYTLPGHPEFVWASFEHTSTSTAPDGGTLDDFRNVAPRASDNPLPTDPENANDTTVVSEDDSFLLYAPGVPANAGNQSIPEANLLLDDSTQKFLNADGTPQRTSIYRMFPASKSNTNQPDDAITSLNLNVAALFDRAAAANALPISDKRGHYRLVGAQWLDKPAYYALDSPLQNDATNPFAQEPGSAEDSAGVGVGLSAFTKAIETDGSDSPYSILAGEDRMSSVAMESFTQAPGSFDNCLTCHNTQAITAKGVTLNRDRGGVKLLDPGLLNVSHVLSQFVLEECTAPEDLVTNSDGSQTAVCP
jgi:hypothetical protein